MSDGDERRQHPRRPLDKEVFCYIDGDRVDARSGDISMGGMFLCTDDRGEIPTGALVSLVFKGAGDPTESVFLFGRVVRQQLGHVPGVGLCWEKAVSAGSAPSLVKLLHRTLGIPSPELQKVVTDRGLTRFVYTFPPPAPPEPEAEAAAEPADATVPGTQPPLLELDEAGPLELGADPGEERVVETLQEVSVDPGPLPPPRAEPSPAPAAHTERGAVTAQLDGKKARLPTQLPAHLEMEGVILPSRIRQVGVTAMFVESRLRPVDPAARVKVRFEIATRDGRAPVLCDARVTGTDSGALCGVPGLEVEILEMNEGKQAGIYTRYLKWLHFRTLSRES